MAKHKPDENPEEKPHKKVKKEKRSDTDGVSKKKDKKHDVKVLENRAVADQLLTELEAQSERRIKEEKKSKKEKKHRKATEDAKPVVSDNKVEDKSPALAKKHDSNRENEFDPFYTGMDVSLAPPESMKEAMVPFADPLADDDQTKELLKFVARAHANDTIRRGVKEVQKELRKQWTVKDQNNKELPKTNSFYTGEVVAVAIIASDISPEDVVSHLPIACEDAHVPYVFVPSRYQLGSSGNTKRPTCVVLIRKYFKGKSPLEQPFDHSRGQHQPLTQKLSAQEMEHIADFEKLLKLVDKVEANRRVSPF